MGMSNRAGGCQRDAVNGIGDRLVVRSALAALFFAGNVFVGDDPDALVGHRHVKLSLFKCGPIDTGAAEKMGYDGDQTAAINNCRR